MRWGACAVETDACGSMPAWKSESSVTRSERITLIISAGAATIIIDKDQIDLLFADFGCFSPFNGADER